jgi:hypothetical protein
MHDCAQLIHAKLTQSAIDSTDDDPMHHLLGHSITYRIAVGPQQGRKVFTLQTLPDCGSDDPFARTAGNVAGFSLHTGVATKAHERDKLERPCRYIARPAVSTQRLSLTRNGQIRYQLKTPYNDGTTHVIFEPLDFHVQDVRYAAGAWMRRNGHRPAARPGAQTQGQSHPLSPCICPPTASIGRW